MNLEIDLNKGLIEDDKSDGYLISIKSPFIHGDCYGDLISIDVDSQSLWFDYRLKYVLEPGWNSEEYIEIEKWLNSIFKGSQIGSSILGFIRKNLSDRI